MNSCFLIFLLSVVHINAQINWQNGDWAMGCDFKGNDLTKALTKGDMCSTKCRQTAGCTHYTWTNFEGGTCWMKKGSVTKSNAVYTGNSNMVCGIVYSNYFY